jgi:hypothetical protein
MKTFALFGIVIIAEAAAAGAVLLAQESGVHFGVAEIAVVTGLMGSLAAAFVYVGRLLLASKDAALAKALDDVKDFRSIAADATHAAQIALAGKQLEEKKGGSHKKHTAILVPVVPEAHSLVTAEQIVTAEKSTLRAAVTAVMLALGEPPRTVHGPEVPIIAETDPAKIKTAESDKVKVIVEGEAVKEPPTP